MDRNGTLFCWPELVISVLAREGEVLSCALDTIMKSNMTPRYSSIPDTPKALLTAYLRWYLIWQKISCPKNLDILSGSLFNVSPARDVKICIDISIKVPDLRFLPQR